MKHDFINLQRFLGPPDYNAGGGGKSKAVKFFDVKFSWVIGIGYSKCVYPPPLAGCVYTIVLPFVTIHRGNLSFKY